MNSLNFESKYQPLGYTSEVLWHFATDRLGRNILPIVLKKYFCRPFSASPQIVIRKDIRNEKYHLRTLELASKSFGARNSLPKTAPQRFAIREPRAVCFADIPFQHLDVHMKRYNGGIGLGFSKKALMERYGEKIQPVHYYHVVTDKILKKISKPYRRRAHDVVLMDYAKIPTIRIRPEDLDESFSAIYLEREWRILDNISVDLRDMTFLALRGFQDFKDVQNRNLSSVLIKHGVSILNVSAIFPRASDK